MSLVVRWSPLHTPQYLRLYLLYNSRLIGSTASSLPFIGRWWRIEWRCNIAFSNACLSSGLKTFEDFFEDWRIFESLIFWRLKTNSLLFEQKKLNITKKYQKYIELFLSHSTYGYLPTAENSLRIIQIKNERIKDCDRKNKKITTNKINW